MYIQGVLESITVLQYADDTMLFLCRADDLEVILQHCLFIFSFITGLRINLHKSRLVGVGIEVDDV